MLAWGPLELYIIGRVLAACVLLGCGRVPQKGIWRYLEVCSIVVMQAPPSSLALGSHTEDALEAYIEMDGRLGCPRG